MPKCHSTYVCRACYVQRVGVGLCNRNWHSESAIWIKPSIMAHVILYYNINIYCHIIMFLESLLMNEWIMFFGWSWKKVKNHYIDAKHKNPKSLQIHPAHWFTILRTTQRSTAPKDNKDLATTAITVYIVILSNPC